MGGPALTEKYPDNSKGAALNMRTRITITGLLFLTVATCLLNIQQQSSLAFAAEEDNNLLKVRKENTTIDIFELLTGIFVARTIAIETRDLYLGGVESPTLETVFSFMFLMALMLFFVAIAGRERIKPKHPQPDI